MKYALKKIRRIRVEGIGTNDKGLHKATLDDLKNVSIKGSNDTEYAEGTDGARLAAFDVKKVSSIEATNGSIDSNFLALQVGADEVTLANSNEVKIREIRIITTAEADNKELYLENMCGTIDSLDVSVWKADEYGNPTTLIKKGGVKDGQYSGKFNCFTSTEDNILRDQKGEGDEIPIGKILLQFSKQDFPAGSIMVIEYRPLINGTKITNDATKFSIPGKIYVDAWFTDLCTEEDMPLQLVMEKGKISGEYDYSFGDSVAVQNLTIEALTSVCFATGKNLWKLYTYDMENADTGESEGKATSENEVDEPTEAVEGTEEPTA